MLPLCIAGKQFQDTWAHYGQVHRVGFGTCYGERLRRGWRSRFESGCERDMRAHSFGMVGSGGIFFSFIPLQLIWCFTKRLDCNFMCLPVLLSSSPTRKTARNYHTIRTQKAPTTDLSNTTNRNSVTAEMGATEASALPIDINRHRKK